MCVNVDGRERTRHAASGEAGYLSRYVATGQEREREKERSGVRTTGRVSRVRGFKKHHVENEVKNESN